MSPSPPPLLCLMYQGKDSPSQPPSLLSSSPLPKVRCLQTSVDLLIHQKGDHKNYPSFLGKRWHSHCSLLYPLQGAALQNWGGGRNSSNSACFELYHLSSSSVSERCPLQETSPFWGAFSVSRVCFSSLLPPLTENFLPSSVHSLLDLVKVRFSWQQKEAQT